MLKRFLTAIVLAALASGSMAAFQRGPGPLRIVLLVDSSGTVAPMLPQFRAGLKAFVDALPGSPEIAFITTGGQLRIRVRPTTDRDQLMKAISIFASDGGANSFLDTMLEADRRFLVNSGDRRPVFVILMTDGNESRGDARVDQYNDWVGRFLRRGGRAHGIVVRGVNSGMTTEILRNLTNNTGGFYESLAIANSLAERMKMVATMVAADMTE
jgi:von Willebrand factor type A domain-containing protein